MSSTRENPLKPLRRLRRLRRTEAMRDAAIGHAVHHVRADHDPTIVTTYVFAQCHFASFGIDAGQDHMRFK